MFEKNDFNITFSEDGIIIASLSKRTPSESLKYLYELVDLTVPDIPISNKKEFYFSSCINLGLSLQIYPNNGDIIILFGKSTPIRDQLRILKSLLVELSFAF